MATNLEEHAPDLAPTRPETMTAALIAWQAAERQLASIPASSPEGNALRGEIEALRLLYKELSGQFAAQTTPIARATQAAPLRAVGPGTAAPATPDPAPEPVAPAAPDRRRKRVVRATPVGETAALARATVLARAKPVVRAKPGARSARTG